MPHSGVMRLRLAKRAEKKRKFHSCSETSRKSAFGKGKKQTKKSHSLKVKGNSTLKSGKFLGGYE